jgi:6-phosphogluconolactonase
MNPFKRRDFLTITGIGLLSIAAATVYSAYGKARKQQGRYRVYVGTYTEGRDEGIYLYDLSPAGVLSKVSSTKAEDASFLALHPKGNYLYAVNEIGDFEGEESGSVSAYTVEKGTGKLALLNKQASKGGSPCYVAVDETGKNVLVANYMGGNIAVLPIQEGGRLGAATHVRQHQGSGPNEDRQEGPHAHSIVIAPGNRFALAADLGTDKIMIYNLDVQKGKLLSATTPFIRTEAGAGPRHIAFGGDHAYVINELNSTLNVYTWDEDEGVLQYVQTISMLPQGFSGKNQCADVHVSADGRFVYGSNRGHNSIAVFARDARSGKLKLVEHTPTQGDWPRNFAITPDGNLLLVANERSNSIVSFRIDKKTGKLTPAGSIAEVSKPVFLLVAPV